MSEGAEETMTQEEQQVNCQKQFCVQQLASGTPLNDATVKVISISTLDTIVHGYENAHVFATWMKTFQFDTTCISARIVID